jgi:replicative DNA helicase
LVDRAEQIVFGIADQRISGDFENMETLLKQSFDRLTEMAQDGRDLTGIASGFRQLDDLTAGFQSSNLVVLAARPGMGKTSLALNMAAHVGVRERRPVAIFSLEMSREEVTMRLMCAEGKVDSKRLRRGNLDKGDWEKLTNASSKLYDAPIFIDDTAGVTPIEIKAKSRRLKSRLKGDLGLVIVDYLQLMRADARIENRVQQVGEMSRGLKILARELEVPVIALSQLSRGVESRTDKRPMLSDLRESGQIEADADCVLMLYRDDYYDHDSERPGEMDIIVRKNRQGRLGQITTRIDSRLRYLPIARDESF